MLFVSVSERTHNKIYACKTHTCVHKHGYIKSLLWANDDDYAATLPINFLSTINNAVTALSPLLQIKENIYLHNQH